MKMQSVKALKNLRLPRKDPKARARSRGPNPRAEKKLTMLNC
jgi:hypothetical protein